MTQFLLTTSRLRVRSFRPNDAQDFFEYRSDPAVCRFQGFDPYTKEQSFDFTREQSAATFGEAGKWVQLAIEHIETGRLIGDIGLQPEAEEPRIVHLGITLSGAFQGQGFAQESLQAVISWLFSFQNINRIVAITDQDNKSSAALMFRLGFEKEGTTRQSFWNAGNCRDEFIFGLLKDTWKQDEGIK